jgi:hypothetical protein
MKRSPLLACALQALTLGSLALVACSGSSSTTTGGPNEQTGQACTSVSQCYPLVDAGALQGTATCLSVTNGYCTHTCQTDADCCAVPGECLTGYKQVCSPFQSANQNYCFLSCDPSAVTAAPDAGTTDPTLYCQKYASSSFTCRSTGGGSANRKVCLP